MMAFFYAMVLVGMAGLISVLRLILGPTVPDRVVGVTPSTPSSSRA